VFEERKKRAELGQGAARGGGNQRGEEPFMYLFNALLDGQRLCPCTSILIQFRFHLVYPTLYGVGTTEHDLSMRSIRGSGARNAEPWSHFRRGERGDNRRIVRQDAGTGRTFMYADAIL
jgi:hypothetical protein